MVEVVLVILTFLSCFLFEFSKVPETSKKLIVSYKDQFRIMSDKSLDDQAKQQQLLKQISSQLILIARLVLGIILFVAPFLSLFILGRYSDELKPEILYSPRGLLIPMFAVLIYILIKKAYARIQQNR